MCESPLCVSKCLEVLPKCECWCRHAHQEPCASCGVRSLTAAQILASSVLASPTIPTDPVVQRLPFPEESDCLPAQLPLRCPPESAQEPQSYTTLPLLVLD